jgi:hypothetical protein
MSRYVVTTFFLAMAIGPAASAGISAQVGGIAVGAGVGVSGKGASVGVSSNVGGMGNVGAGASAGVSPGSNGSTSIGVGGQVGGTSGSAGVSAASGGFNATGNVSSNLGGGKSTAGISAATGGGSNMTGSVSAAGRLSASSRSQGVRAGSTASNEEQSPEPAAAVAEPTGIGQSISLPRILLPWGRRSRDPVVTTIPGTPPAILQACRDAVETAAAPFNAVKVRARSAGVLRHLDQGGVSAPIAVLVDYERRGGREIRQARIRCQLDATGKVIGLT